MIQASQRQSDSSPSSLTVHKQLARKKLWHYKLTAASLLCAVVSVLFWLIGSSLFVHLLAILVSFLVGVFYPVRETIRWAQRYISKSIGESYQTSLEHPGQLPFGLDEALAAYTKRSLNKLEPVSFKRWWLPLMVISLGLTLLPYSPLRTQPRVLGLPGIDSNPFAGAEESQQQQQQLGSPEDPQLNQAQELQAPNNADSQETNRPQTLDDAPGSQGQSLNDIAENVADEEALSRFLENMRERDAQVENQAQQPPPQAPESNSSQGNPNQQGETEGNQTSQNSEEQSQSGEQTQGEGDEAQGSEQQPGGETAEGQNPEGSDSSGEANDPEETQSQDQGMANSGEQPDSQGPTQNSPNEATDEGADGAGINSSASRQTIGIEEGAQAEPEFLQGQLSAGQSNLAGTVRLPGSSQENPGNFGPTAEGFQRAEEQAVTEGRIPIEYQEIIKNYFR